MQKILVIGEAAIDRTTWGQCERLSPEAAVPVFLPVRETVTPGLASNTYANLVSLGERFYRIDSLFPESKIEKHRFIQDKTNHHILRVDKNDHIEKPLSVSEVERINFSQYAAVCISDYNKNYLSKSILKLILDKTKLNNVPTFLDTKKILGEWCQSAFVVKINEKEYNLNKEKLDAPEKYCDNLIVTLGENGCIEKKTGMIVPTFKRNVVEASGSGDSYHSALVLGYLQTKSLKVAMEFANYVAGLAVSRPGIITISFNELCDSYKNLITV